MLYNIKASFTGVLKVGLNAMLIITLLTKPPPVASLIALHWYAQLLNWGKELTVTFRDWDNIAR